jgi:hypothetical protein
MVRAVTRPACAGCPAFQLPQHRRRDINRGDVNVRRHKVEVQTRAGTDH